ncbi:ATP-binding protein [Streptomyces tendae]|uniref:ATP-binding protein n=1 Tax=Streptomyces tendae TaxID=1932 RepID=UPI00343087CE
MSPRLMHAADGTEVRTQTLPREAESAAIGRRIVHRALEDWALEDLTYAAELVVTELIANAVQHARFACLRVTVRHLEPRLVRVAVTDRSHAEPVLRPHMAYAEEGRGLALVDALTVGWGHDPLPWGKRVWADVGEAT